MSAIFLNGLQNNFPSFCEEEEPEFYQERDPDLARIKWRMDRDRFTIQGSYEDVDGLLDACHELIESPESELYKQYGHFGRLLRDVIAYGITRYKQGSQKAGDWLVNRLPLFLRDYDDQDFLKCLCGDHPSLDEFCKRFEIFIYQAKSPLVHLNNCDLDYASHTNPSKRISIASLDSFQRLFEMGQSVSQLCQSKLHKFVNFALADLRLLIKAPSEAGVYYQVVSIPIRDVQRSFASVRSYFGNENNFQYGYKKRNIDSAHRIANRYLRGVEIAKSKDSDFKECVADHVIENESRHNDDYELKYHHGEQALFEYLEADDKAAVAFILQQMQQLGVKSYSKIYAAILDVYSTQASCQACQLATLGIQDKKSPNSFFSALEAALKTQRYRLSRRTRTKLGEEKRPCKWSSLYEKQIGLKTAVRYVTTYRYTDKNQVVRTREEPALDWAESTVPHTPVRKNIKTDMPITILSIFGNLTVKPELSDRRSQYTLFSSTSLTQEESKHLL